ncbi:hypothetical protein ACHAWF_001179 [Thalassiosira exigua]
MSSPERRHSHLSDASEVSDEPGDGATSPHRRFRTRHLWICILLGSYCSVILRNFGLLRGAPAVAEVEADDRPDEGGRESPEGRPPVAETDDGPNEHRKPSADRWWAGKFRVQPELEAKPSSALRGDALLWIDPNCGARHPNGSLGMIVDPSVERLASFLPEEEYMWMAQSSSAVAERSRRLMTHYVDRRVVCPGGHGGYPGVEGADGHMVLKKVRGGIGASVEFIRNSNNGNPGDVINHGGRGSNGTGTHGPRKRRIKILCLVYTAYMPHKDAHGNLRAQAQIWERRCDGFIGASNRTDHSIGAIDLPHLGPEEYGNMWQKVRTVWVYAYRHYLDGFDWFHIVGDDVYVAVDNLQAYLDGPDVRYLEEGCVDRIFKVQDRILRPVPPTKDPRNKRAGLVQENRNKRTDRMRPRPLLLGIPMPHFKGGV